MAIYKIKEPIKNSDEIKAEHLAVMEDTRLNTRKNRTSNAIKITGGKCRHKYLYDTMTEGTSISVVINGIACKFRFNACYGRYIVNGMDCDRIYFGDDDMYGQDVTCAGGGNRYYAIYIPKNIIKSAPKENQKDFSFTGQYYSTAPVISYFKNLLKSLLSEHPEYFYPEVLDKLHISTTMHESKVNTFADNTFNSNLKTKLNLEETTLPANRSGAYDKTQLENDLLALNDIDKVDWDLSGYNELGEVIVLTHRAFEDSLDMSTYYMQRTNLLREILKVFDKNNLKLVDPIEDQGTWWYFVLEHKNSVESSDKPQLEYVMVEFFETSGTPADDIMRRTKGVKYADLSKLSELLVNADKIFREVNEYGGYNKVYFDNYIRYQGKLYKFHAGRVDIGDGPAEVSIPANYSEQVTSYFLSELNSGNNTIPVVEG